MDNSPEKAQAAMEPHNSLRRLRRWKGLPLFLSFLLPFLITGILISYKHLTTPGVNMLLAGDALYQYHPFLSNFRDKLSEGGSMFYSWNLGMGGSYLSLAAYYLSSPLYLLSPLVPESLLPHFYTLALILKLALAGYFMAWFLRIVYGKNDLSLPLFSLLYALCAWAVGYGRNIMWTDVFALLPLLMAGTVSLLRDGKFRLYVISLAACLWCNYYVAFFCCIFVLLSFSGYNICKWNGAKNFLRRFLRISICTLIGTGIACVLLIPTLLAMQSTYSAMGESYHLLSLNIINGANGNVSEYGSAWKMLLRETIPGIVRASRLILNELLVGKEPTILEGLPNIFSGLSTLILAIYYLCCSKIPKRERIFNFGLLAFILLSFILRMLDYVWHGFHFTNLLPYRFSFLFSFILIVMAYRAYLLIDEFKLKYFLAIIPFVLLLIGNAYLQNAANNNQLVLSLLVLIGISIYFLLNRKCSKAPTNRFAAWFFEHRKRIASGLLLFIVVCEMSLSFYTAINKLGLNSQYNADGSLAYPIKQEEIQELQNYLQAKEEGVQFYRMETTAPKYINDAALTGYNGISTFHSSVNANTNRFLRSLGIATQPEQNTFSYYEASPFTNTMCGIKYLYDRNGRQLDTDYNTYLTSSGTVELLENRSFISVGFMTGVDLQSFVAEEERIDILTQQSEMFRMATGIEEALYTHYTADDFITPEGTTITPNASDSTQYDYSVGKTEGRRELSVMFDIAQDGLYVFSTESPSDGYRSVEIFRNGEILCSRVISARALFSLGNLSANDEIEFRYSVTSAKSGSISLDFAKQNDEIYDAGHALLADEPFVLSECADGYLLGNVEALSDGLFYTSIPYEPGWSAYVDGKEVKLAETYDAQSESVKLTDAMISFPLSAGSHEIELVYTAPGLYLGLAISCVSLLGFIALWFCLRKKHVFLPDH